MTKTKGVFPLARGSFLAALLLPVLLALLATLPAGETRAQDDAPRVGVPSLGYLPMAEDDPTGTILVDWGAVAAPTGMTVRYDLQASDDGQDPWDTVAEGVEGTEYRHAGLSPGDGFNYRVRAVAVDASGQRDHTSDWSASKRGWTALIGIPQNLVINPSATSPASALTLTWEKPIVSVHITSLSYIVYEVPDGFSVRDWIRGGSLGLSVLARDLTETEYTHTGLSPLTAKRYAILPIFAANGHNGPIPALGSGTTRPAGPVNLSVAPAADDPYRALLGPVYKGQRERDPVMSGILLAAG